MNSLISGLRHAVLATAICAVSVPAAVSYTHLTLPTTPYV